MWQGTPGLTLSFPLQTVNKKASHPLLACGFSVGSGAAGDLSVWGNGMQLYLVQFDLLLLREVAIAVLEVLQNHFLPRSIAEKGGLM